MTARFTGTRGVTARWVRSPRHEKRRTSNHKASRGETYALTCFKIRFVSEQVVGGLGNNAGVKMFGICYGDRHNEAENRVNSVPMG